MKKMMELKRDQFNFEKLIVYQKAIEFIKHVYTVTAKFPKSEMYGLASQFRNAANSIALNIGEGSAGTKNEFLNFIRISFRSLNECVVCITIACQQKYLSHDQENNLRLSLLEITRL